MRIARLEASSHRIPDLSALGKHLLVPFPVRRLDKARVLWLNDRWFLEGGLDIRIPRIRVEILQDLLDRFGVTGPVDGEPPVMSSSPQYLAADRYGGSAGANHGGSGRCGIMGNFNAKGVGQTPLVAGGVDWIHWNGCLWLSDAIREAIDAEIASAELPYGAVPVIAIIDTGTSVKRADEGLDERRAILVRPNFARPAHFERSIYFGRGGLPGSEQHLDALRTREAVAFVSGAPADLREANIIFDGLRSMFLRFAEQIGAARAHRLWQGPFFTANMSIDGALVDFGSFRAVPSWRKSSVEGYPGEGFGEDKPRLDNAISSLCAYFRKYAGHGRPVPAAKELGDEVNTAIDAAFLQNCVSMLGLPEDLDEEPRSSLSAFFENYYRVQQRERIYINRPKEYWRRPWLYDALTRKNRDVAIPASEALAAHRLHNLLDKVQAIDGAFDKETCLARLCDWLRPRPLLYRDVNGPRTIRFVARLTGDLPVDQAKVSAYIAGAVQKSRRLSVGLNRSMKKESV